MTAAAVTKRLSSETGSSHFQANPISWSTRTRGNVARIQMKVNTNPNVFSINQSNPTTQSKLTNAQPRIAATTRMLNKTNPMISACQAGIFELSIQNGAASTRIAIGGITASSTSNV